MKRLINKKSIVLLIIFILLTTWVLTRDNQADLPYRVTGKELLEIKEKCKSLAEQKLEEWNSSGLGYHSLNEHGYSEYKGYCYAEFIRTFNIDGETSKYIVLYNSTEEREMTVRQWPDYIAWYESDFDMMVLGKTRIVDFRKPW